MEDSTQQALIRLERMPDKRDVIVYQHNDRAIEITSDIDARTVWGTQREIGDLLDLNVKLVSKHIANFRTQHGAKAESHISKIAITAADGKVYEVEIYDLDVILHVGYRAHASEQVIAFREWVGAQLDAKIAEDKKRRKRDTFLRSRKYLALRHAGYSHEQAIDWYYRDRIGADARKEIADEWYHRNGSIPQLSNFVNKLVTGKTAGQLKKELGIKVSPRAYMSSAKKTAIAIVEGIGASLHRIRNSSGTVELARDLTDAFSVIDWDRLNQIAPDVPVPPPLPKGKQRQLLMG